MCNTVLWAVWPTSLLLCMWIWEADCDVRYQSEEGECSGVLSSVCNGVCQSNGEVHVCWYFHIFELWGTFQRRVRERESCQEVFQEKIGTCVEH